MRQACDHARPRDEKRAFSFKLLNSLDRDPKSTGIGGHPVDNFANRHRSWTTATQRGIIEKFS
jgi:hypothetical protein